MHLRILYAKLLCVRMLRNKIERRWKVDGGGGGLHTPEQCPGSQCALGFEKNLSTVQVGDRTVLTTLMLLRATNSRCLALITYLLSPCCFKGPTYHLYFFSLPEDFLFIKKPPPHPAITPGKTRRLQKKKTECTLFH